MEYLHAITMGRPVFFKKCLLEYPGDTDRQQFSGDIPWGMSPGAQHKGLNRHSRLVNTKQQRSFTEGLSGGLPDCQPKTEEDTYPAKCWGSTLIPFPPTIFCLCTDSFLNNVSTTLFIKNMVEAICKTRVGHITQWQGIRLAGTMPWVQSSVLQTIKSKKICEGKQKRGEIQNVL